MIDALEASWLGDISPAARTTLLESASEAWLQRGDIVRANRGPEGLEDPRSCCMVVDGLLRTYTESANRQVTIGYVVSGQLLGIAPSLRVVGPIDHLGCQALTDTRLLCLDPTVLAELCASDLTVAGAIIDHLSNLLVQNVGHMSENVLRPLRQRVARHLLDLADRETSPDRESSRFVVRARVQDIADAVGSSREVITAILRGLREDGLVVRENRLLVLPDPARLHDVERGEG